MTCISQALKYGIIVTKDHSSCPKSLREIWDAQAGIWIANKRKSRTIDVHLNRQAHSISLSMWLHLRQSIYENHCIAISIRWAKKRKWHIQPTCNKGTLSDVNGSITLEWSFHIGYLFHAWWQFGFIIVSNRFCKHWTKFKMYASLNPHRAYCIVNQILQVSKQPNKNWCAFHRSMNGSFKHFKHGEYQFASNETMANVICRYAIGVGYRRFFYCILFNIYFSFGDTDIKIRNDFT